MEVKVKIEGVEYVFNPTTASELKTILDAVREANSGSVVQSPQPAPALARIPNSSGDEVPVVSEDAINRFLDRARGRREALMMAFMAEPRRWVTDDQIREFLKGKGQEPGNLGSLFSTISKWLRATGLPKSAIYEDRVKKTPDRNYYAYQLTPEAARLIKGYRGFNIEMEPFPVTKRGLEGGTG